VRRVLRRELAEFAGIRVLVTHDPLEAAALADRLLVLEGGRVVQAGTAGEVTQRPRSAYVADLAGVNLYRGHARGGRLELETGGSLHVSVSAEGDLYAVVHPRTVALYRGRPEGTPRNVWAGRVAAVDRQSDRVRVSIGGEIPIVAEVTPAAVADLGLAESDQVWVAVKASEISVYPA
jgi:molybdate transport system ATP-binding protein